MESLKELTTVFCAVCLLSGGLALLSNGLLEKSVGYILSLILLASVVGAVAKIDIDMNIKTETESTAATVGAEGVSEYQAEYICRSLLEEKGINYEKVEATATKKEDGSIIISKITVKGTDRGAEAVKTVVESGLCDRVDIE